MQRADFNHDSSNGFLLQEYWITSCCSNSTPFSVHRDFLFQCQTMVESFKRHFKWQLNSHVITTTYITQLKSSQQAQPKPSLLEPGLWQPYHDSSLAHCGCQMPPTACLHLFVDNRPRRVHEIRPFWQCLSPIIYLGLCIMFTFLIDCFSRTVFDCLINSVFTYRHPVGIWKS